MIFVLMTLTTFSLLGLGLSFRARIENRLSQYFTAEYENLYLAKSRLNRIMIKIAQDNNNYDSFGEDWAKKESIDFEEEGSLKIVTEDEDGKLDINTVTNEWLNNLFFTSKTLIDRIVKNRPFLVEEEMFYLIDSDEKFFSAKEKSSLLKLVTTQNHDKMNINTIREEVLYSMPGLSRSTADAILSLRRNEAINNLEVLKNVAGVTIDEYQTLNKILKTTSNFYTVRIQIDDRKNRMNKSFRITLKKDLEAKTVKVIRWLEQ